MHENPDTSGIEILGSLNGGELFDRSKKSGSMVGTRNDKYRESIIAVRSCKESIDKNMKVKSRLVLSLFVIFASVVVTATLNNNSVDVMFHVKITDPSVVAPLAISLLSAFLVVRLASSPEKIENLFGSSEVSSYDILKGRAFDNKKIFELEQAKANRVKLIDEFSSSVLAVSLLTFIAGCFFLLLTAPEYNSEKSLIAGAVFFTVLSSLFVAVAIHRAIKNKLFFNVKEKLLGRDGESNKIVFKQIKPICVLVLSIAFVISASFFCYVKITDDNREERIGSNIEGLTDKMEYKTEGLYDNDTKGYRGAWEVILQDGKVESSIMEVTSVEASSVHRTLSLSVSNPIHDRESGYQDIMPDKNQILKGTTYLGHEFVTTPNYGEKNLSVYADNDTRYYVGDEGKIYRAVLTVETIGIDTDNIRVIFDLLLPNDQLNGG